MMNTNCHQETLQILKALSKRVAILEQKFENLLFTPPELLPYGAAKARFEKTQQQIHSPKPPEIHAVTEKTPTSLEDDL